MERIYGGLIIKILKWNYQNYLQKNFKKNNNKCWKVLVEHRKILSSNIIQNK